MFPFVARRSHLSCYQLNSSSSYELNSTARVKHVPVVAAVLHLDHDNNTGHLVMLPQAPVAVKDARDNIITLAV